MFKTENEFDSIIKQEWGLPVVYDGIINIDEYKKATPKILWILKESNENNKLDERNHREFHEDVSIYPKWKLTYKNIILPTYGMMHNLAYKNLPSINNDSKINDENVLEKIAIININKSGGTSRSSDSVIKWEYEKHKNILLQQIAGIAPEVIINCSRVSCVFDDLCGNYNLKEKEWNFISEFGYKVNYAENSKVLIIDYWHPGAHIKHEAYQKQILDIYQKWKKNR